MSFAAGLRAELEEEERRTVGASFGGSAQRGGSYSVSRIRDWIIDNYTSQPFSGAETVESLKTLAARVPRKSMREIVSNAVRYAFLIELTDLKVGSTKMKTRWLPGLIQMPQPGSFEPMQGTFEPGNDQRAASFEDCLSVFEHVISLVVSRVPDKIGVIDSLRKCTRVPYEFFVGYKNPKLPAVHNADNVQWIENDDIDWLVKARGILRSFDGQTAEALREIEQKKLEVKVYKTDRALTGKDKTNRAKRWEVLHGDFQFATLRDCWSVERKLTEELIFFEDFPKDLKQKFIDMGLVVTRTQATRCPITLAPLNFDAFATAMLNATHGRSDYQIGHLTPLKRGGHHIGTNIAWLSADGNRIQGDLTLEETLALLGEIEKRRSAGIATPSVDAGAPR
jgi:hypothetical protein